MRNVREQAHRQPSQPIMLVSGDNWHEGIIGLVAGKLAEEINKPVLVLSTDPATQLSRGSARSQKGFNIIEALRSFSHNLVRYGGHAQAAGFTIQSDLIEQLREHLVRWHEYGGLTPPALIEGTALPDPTGMMTEQETSETEPALQPRMIDLTITRFERINYQTYQLLRQLAPFGAGNPDPIFKMERMCLVKSWLSGLNKQNLSMRLGSPDSNHHGHFRNELLQKGTLTRGATEQERLKDVTRVDVIFRLDSNDDDNRAEVWLKILDFAATETTTSDTPRMSADKPADNGA
jgi:single-stranded-DNA-specific exonuclease